MKIRPDVADAEWSHWSDREIARRCQVSHDLVRRIRRRASGIECQTRPRKVQRGATVYEMHVEKNSSEPAAPDRVVSTPFEAPSTPATDRLGILLPSETAGSATPYCGYCPRCHARHPGRANPACQLCCGRGWLSQREFELCPTSERNVASGVGGRPVARAR